MMVRAFLRGKFNYVTGNTFFFPANFTLKAS